MRMDVVRPGRGRSGLRGAELPEWDDPAWVRWAIDQMGEIDSHPQEVIDNMADAPHLGPIHGSMLEYFENEVRDHVVIQRQGGGHKTLAASNTLLETDTFYTGPAILISRLTVSTMRLC